MRFWTLAGMTLYSWVVWVASKVLTTALSVSYAEFINKWYDQHHRLVESIPRYGQTLRALMRDNIADGTIAYWEIWFALGLFLVFLRHITGDLPSAIMAATLITLLAMGGVYFFG